MAAPAGTLPLFAATAGDKPARPKCKRCRLPLPAGKKPRCKLCDKGEYPEPGRPIHKRWLRGLRETIRARLEERGLGRCAMQAVAAIYSGEPCPEEAKPLIADILAMPTTVQAWWDEADARVCAALVEQKLRAEGVSAEEAMALAKEARAWSLAKKKAQRAGLPPPEPDVTPKLRVHVERLRVAEHVDHEAEREAMAEEERHRDAQQFRSLQGE